LKLIEKSNVDNNQLDHTDQLIKSIKDNPRNVIGRQLEHEWSDKKWKGRVIALQDNEFEVNIRHLTVHHTLFRHITPELILSTQAFIIHLFNCLMLTF
jgi:hypothetical protein